MNREMGMFLHELIGLQGIIMTRKTIPMLVIS